MDHKPGQQTGQQTVSGQKSLDDWRRQIDALDTDLLRLLNQRAAIACEIAVVKVVSGMPAYDGTRESQVLARVLEKNTGPLDAQSVTDIFAGIIRETRRLGTQRMQEQSGQASDKSSAIKPRVGNESVR
jgi:chorismate mutase